ncbi:hypothetical protein COW36_14020 [bacterium (Candidatus Blackallbacteria) CG17_big_fil_post_rev_8_21_14_2_50_48_46]|uniref:Methyltransferase FkbM domain-containing protein n=1 Tax=bacterium (Candidatus Blackallbacteria) CG17_big_fil_post_rev_8_21_14_2_50_48_46 TaxID=2014261 RepID=A0A2M7G337_9BACT|nr:MAG: hypothetical protein COW64_23490 [bacterium (Candidatus Blackallbacteria) CG18_big_fil_WC_8_21_14_2_50_49_26]PIW16241.1 MAG: hypothetical protein COW36_14020 [bacterium (Candidatus Blackallbacteria) CG17_big_fil_post_rev_8_21_14_2_50_48_46]PIW49878.1 MAG: hypothetical protein COW20_04285 [bacterium (Candidatus Blackallbacteria) CG13_big_fil_rev_8_21_14_2_50_49_14]
MLQLEVSPGYLVYFHECIWSVAFFLNPLLPHLPNRFCVDLGAADGQNGSNTFLLFLNGWLGLAIEREARYFQAMQRTYRELGLQIALQNSEITPDNIPLLLATENVPSEFAFLSLDIDSCDYWVLKQLLAYYRPIVICTEINETIPPPLRFTLLPEAKPHAPSHFFGYSLSLLHDLAKIYHYDLVRLDFNNAFLVAREYNFFWPALSAEEAYLSYRKNPRPDYNQDMEKLLSWPAAQNQDFLNQHFAAYAAEYTLYTSKKEIP